MKKTTLRSVIVAMILAIGLFCTSGIAFAEGETVFNSAAEITAALGENDSVTGTLGADVGGFTVPANKTLNLSLGGYTVNGKVINYGTFKANGGTLNGQTGNAIDCKSGYIELNQVHMKTDATSSAALSTDTAEKITISNGTVESTTGRAIYAIKVKSLELSNTT